MRKCDLPRLFPKLPRWVCDRRTTSPPSRGVGICQQIRSLLRNLGSPTWARTRDLRINSPSLYQLSYRGSGEPVIIGLRPIPVNSVECLEGAGRAKARSNRDPARAIPLSWRAPGGTGNCARPCPGRRPGPRLRRRAVERARGNSR